MPTREELAALRHTEPIFDSPWYINEDKTIGWTKQKSTQQKIRILSHSIIVSSWRVADLIGIGDTPATSQVMRIEDNKIKWLAPTTDTAKLALLERIAGESAFDLSVLNPYVSPDT